MIRTKKELKFYIMADRMMNKGYFKPSLKQMIKESIFPDYPDFIMRYLIAMRKYSYYSKRGGVICSMLSRYNSYKYKRLGIKLVFSIGQDVFGYGLVIPHYGTIVVGGTNQIGNYAVLHTSSCITDKAKIIGDGLYLSTGAKIITGENIGDGVTVAANAVLTQGCPEGYTLFAGIPAKAKERRNIWYEHTDSNFAKKVQAIENLKDSIELD